jgi:hypothetical protein
MMSVSQEQREGLLSVLQFRFEKNMKRHKDLGWASVQAKLEPSSNAPSSPLKSPRAAAIASRTWLSDWVNFR